MLKEFLPQASLTHLLTSESDHLPILLHMDNPSQVQCTYRWQFQFESMWTRDLDCLDVIRSSWRGGDSSTIITKWKEWVANCSRGLQVWSQHSFGNLHSQHWLILSKLNRLGVSVGVPQICQQVLKYKLVEIECREEMMWRQWSRQLWLKEGDCNTWHFHVATTLCRKNN